jgi:DNA-damage-inducible protein D
MSTDISVFHFGEDRPSFEDLGRPNGITHWTEATLREALGYQTGDAFQKAVVRAKQTCLTLGIEIEDHFVRQADGGFLLTRFACYLVAMNGDPRKPEVASAQAYFAAIAETFQDRLQHSDGIDRLLIREEIADGQRSLASTAKRHGVQNYAFFQDAGYVGMYNMTLRKLSAHKGLKDGEKLIDRMGKQEMAAHLFRITQTDARIERDDVRGQSQLEHVAKHVGQAVRKTMEETSGTRPETLPLAEDVKEVKKKLRGTRKNLQELDAKRSRKKKRDE